MTTTTKTTRVGITGLDRELWRRVRVAALAEGITASELVTRALQEWLASQQAKGEGS